MNGRRAKTPGAPPMRAPWHRAETPAASIRWLWRPRAEVDRGIVVVMTAIERQKPWILLQGKFEAQGCQCVHSPGSGGSWMMTPAGIPVQLGHFGPAGTFRVCYPGDASAFPLIVDTGRPFTCAAPPPKRSARIFCAVIGSNSGTSTAESFRSLLRLALRSSATGRPQACAAAPASSATA